MFAGAIELNYREEQVSVAGSLKKQSLSPEGLAQIPFDDSAIWQAEKTSRVTLVQQRKWNTVESKKEKGILYDPETETRILSWSRIDNRDELLAELNVASLNENDQNLIISDAGLILVCWKQWRESICEHLIGDFAFAVYEVETESRSETLFLGRDHLGIKPLYFYQEKDCFVFATSLAVITGCHSLNLEHSDEWLARYVLGCAEDWSIAAYKQVKKVPPAHCLLFKDGESRIRRYFELSQNTDLKLESDQAYVDEYLHLFSEAVKVRSQSDYGVASELSGGLDSSSITAIATQQISDSCGKLQTYGIVRSEDEPACIEAVNQSLDMPKTTVFNKSDLGQNNFESLENDFMQTLGTPVEQDIANVHSLFYQDAEKKGIRILLSGFGGDEFTTNYAGLVLLELWNKGEYLQWFERFRGGWITSKLRALKWLFHNFCSKGGSYTSKYLTEQAFLRWKMSPISGEISAKYNLENKNKAFVSYDKGHKTLNSFILGNRWSPLMTARLESCTLMAARYGIEYRWPLLDIRLLKFFLSVPAKQKLGPGGLGRYLHRRAMVGLLPEQIIWRNKNMGGPLRDTINKGDENFNKDTDSEVPELSLPEALEAGAGATVFAKLLDVDACKKLIGSQFNSQLNYQFNSQNASETSRLVQKGFIHRINRLARWFEYQAQNKGL